MNARRVTHPVASTRGWLALALGLAAMLGCTGSTEPRFVLNMQGRQPDDFRITGSESEGEKKTKQIRIAGRQFIVDALTAMFGTPNEPAVFEESGLDLAKVQMAAGPAAGDATGRQRGLYRKHCVHCHGISGDGAGPTAAFLNPYPRDYRKGVFKFKATETKARPTDADLRRILVDGITGTAMPSFALLPGDEIDALVEYVKYLALRGECESQMAFMAYDNEEELEPTREFLVESVLTPKVEAWKQAKEQVVQIADRPPIDTPEKKAASIAAGRALFVGPKAQCMKCHGPTGLGDGSEEQLFDAWNNDKVPDGLRKQIAAALVEGKDTRELLAKARASAALWQLPPQELQPRNLRLGIYRFGRSPADLYRRIHAGIAGTPMPAAGPGPGNPGTLKPEEIWQIVDYIRSLPYEPISNPRALAGVTIQKDRN